MSTKYVRKDHLYNKAKDDGFRSRAAYKLLELNKKHQLIRPNHRVLDLGAWPGGWIQAARSVTGGGGKIVGIDLVAIEDFGDPSIKLIAADFRDPIAIEEALGFAGGEFDAVLSDLSPKLSGIKGVDQNASVDLVENALAVAARTLKKGGAFVCKLFKGNESEVFVKTARPLFNKTIRAELDATRQSSNEYYLICLGLK